MDLHFDFEPPVVVRALDRHGTIHRGVARCLLNEFLQATLGVADREPGGALSNIPHDPRGEPASGVESPVEPHSGNERLDDIGEDLGLDGVSDSAPAEPDESGEARAAREVRERLGVDQSGAHASEASFAGVRHVLEQQLAHAQAEHRIAEELEPFVVVAARVLVDVAGVGERLDQVARLPVETEFGKQFGDGRKGGHGGALRRGALVPHLGSEPRPLPATERSSGWDRASGALGEGALAVGRLPGYAVVIVANLVACPFCREMFQAGEADLCPSCGLALSDLAKLPPSYEAKLEDDWPDKPEWETLPLLYWRRGRLALLIAAVIGVVLFFLPWIHETAPDRYDFTGFELARRLVWMWACAVSWGMLIPVVLARRSVARMRSARVAASLFCAIPLVSAVVLMLAPPHPPPNLRIAFAFHFGIGLYGTVVVAALVLPFAIKFGGRIDDLPTQKGHGRHEHLN